MKYDWLEDYLQSLPGVEKDFKIEWQWERYMIRGKLFAAVCSPEGMKDERYNGHTLVNLKCDPRLAELYREEHPEVLPGFYCDKRNWNAVLLDGALPDGLLREMCRRSYELVRSKLPKYVQQEIEKIVDIENLFGYDRAIRIPQSERNRRQHPCRIKSISKAREKTT